MVSVRRRKGKKRDTFLIDYRDGSGRRRYETCYSRDEANRVAARKTLESGQARPALLVDRNITVKDYASRWLDTLALSVKPGTRETYGWVLTIHVLPALGWMRLRQLHQARIREMLADRFTAGFAVGTVRLIAAVLGSMLATAVDDGLLLTNPATGVRRKLRALRERAGSEQAGAKALTGGQLSTFLDTALARTPRYYPLFLLLARTGLRVGEALALRWADVDLVGRQIRVSHTLTPRRVLKNSAADARLGTPKSGKARTVDMSRGLRDVLEDLQRRRREDALAGSQGQSPWLFVNRGGVPCDQADIRGVFARVVKAAKLPEHLTPHCLRQSFAVQLIQLNTPLPYIQAQLGHASISMTVDVYGRWLPTGNRTLIDQLDGDKVTEPAARAAVGGAVGPALPAVGYKSATNRDDADAALLRLLDSTGLIPPPALGTLLYNLFASS